MLGFPVGQMRVGVGCVLSYGCGNEPHLSDGGTAERPAVGARGPVHPELSSAFSWRCLVEGEAGDLLGYSLLSLLGSCLLPQLLPLHRYRSPPWFTVCAGYLSDGLLPSDCPTSIRRLPGGR